MKSAPTPETDALRDEIWDTPYRDGDDFSKMLDQAKKLERERDAAVAERDEAVRSCHIWQKGHAELVKERDRWREKAEHLAVTCYSWEDNWKLLVKEIDAAIAERDTAIAFLVEARNLLESSKATRKSLIDACDSLQVEVRELKEQRDEARREAEGWRDCFKTGMSLQPKAPSQVFPWENETSAGTDAGGKTL